MPYEKDGYVYPLPGQASGVRDILERQLKNTDTVINTDERVVKAKIHINKKSRQQDGFNTTASSTYIMLTG